MKHKKVLLVFGTRPEAIKMCPVYLKLKECSDFIDTKICVTGQHREMLDQVLSLFDIVPDYDLAVMKTNQDLFDLTSNIILGLREVLDLEVPDIVLVHGDTTTSFAASLSAFYKKIKVGHIEAGLRTFNKYSPWPEEINRQLTSKIADYHFAPTELSKLNLENEKISKNSIFVTGNTVIDSLLLFLDKIETSLDIENSLIKQLLAKGYPISPERNKKIVLITGHRRENLGIGFENICNSIKELANRYSDVDFIYPVHLNPSVRNTVNDILGTIGHGVQSNVYLIEPLDYLPFIYLMYRSYIILTDSGGIQEEAPSLGKPVLVMRDTTERPEAVEAGTVKLVGTDKYLIIEEVSNLLENKSYYERMSSIQNPYGDGFASERIVSTLKCM